MEPTIGETIAFFTLILTGISVWLYWRNSKGAKPDDERKAEASLLHITRGVGQDEPHPPEECDLPRVKVVYRFGPGQIPREWRQTDYLIAKADMVTGVTARYRYTGDPQAVKLEVHEGGTLGRVFNPTDMDLQSYNINFARPLRRGEDHVVSHSRYIQEGTSIPKPFVGWGPTRATRLFQLEVVFHPSETPINVRRVIGLAMAFPQPTEPPQALAESSPNTFTAEFENPRGGWGYGIAWDWR